MAASVRHGYSGPRDGSRPGPEAAFAGTSRLVDITADNLANELAQGLGSAAGRRGRGGAI